MRIGALPAWLALAVVAGCGGDDARPRRERAALLAACVDAIEAGGAAAPGDQLAPVRRGCAAALDGLDPAGEPRAALAAVAAWVERTLRAGVADRQAAQRVEHVTGRATFVLPPPAPPGLAAATHRAPPRARQFVEIGRELRLGALEHVRLRAGRLVPVPVPGAAPGQLVDADQLGPVYARHAEALAAHVGAAPAPPLVLADAATPLAAVLDAVTRLGADTVELAVGAGDLALAHPVVLERKALQFGAPELALAPAAIAIRGFGDDRLTDWAGLPAELDHFAAVNAPVRSIELLAHDGATVAELVRLLDAGRGARVSSLLFAPAPVPAR